MSARNGMKYGLDETLCVLDALEQNKTIEQVASALERSKAGLRAKFISSRALEDGRTSSRGIKQYKSLAELYCSFGEVLPTNSTQAKKDVLDRIERFQSTLRGYSNE